MLQYLHRRLVAKCSELPSHLELRRDGPLPVDDDFASASFMELFVDNIDGFAFGNEKKNKTMKEYVLAVRSTGESFGIIYDDGEKRITGGEHMRTLGADIRSSTRGARPLGSRRADICDLTVFIMGEDDPAAKHVEMTGGVWVHIAQYKRQLMTCFKRLWMVVQSELG